MSDNRDKPGLRSVGLPRRMLLTHDMMLGQRLLLHVQARFLVVVAIVAGAHFADSILGIEGLDVWALTWLALSIGTYNVGILVLLSKRRGGPAVVEHLSMLHALLVVSMVLDYLALTAALWLVGGARSPFVAFYLFHLVIASFLLSRRGAWFSTLLATLMLWGLVLGEYLGLIPQRSPIGAVAGYGPLDGRYVFTVLAVYTTLFVLISLLITGLIEILRRTERASNEKTVQLERLSAMRRDFLHVVLHDVNSPIGAASMLVRNLRDGLCGSLEEGQIEQLDRVQRKLNDVQDFVRDLRMLAELDSGDFGQHMEEVPMASLVAEIVEEHQDLAAVHAHSLGMEHGARLMPVKGIPRLLREAVSNYLTNAIKYTPDGGSIRARVGADSERVRVEVTDSGIGISVEDQDRLFGEFVRVGQKGGALKHVRGTGLGLSIVRRIIEAHGGRVGVESSPGRGSTFWLELPKAGAQAASEDSDGNGGAPVISPDASG